MRHPFETWPARHRRPVFLGLLVATLLTGLFLLWLGGDITTDEAPRGQLSLQQAGNREKAAEIVHSWEREDVMHRAGLNIGADYLFMVVYSTALAAACAGVAARCRWRTRTFLPTAGVLLGYGAWLSGVLDAIENALMVPILDNPDTGGSPEAVTTFAYAKYALIWAAVLYLAVGLIATWRERRKVFSLSQPPP